MPCRLEVYMYFRKDDNLTKSMFEFCFWIIKWNYFERKKANFAVECGQFDEKFNEFVAKIQHFLAKG